MPSPVDSQRLHGIRTLSTIFAERSVCNQCSAAAQAWSHDPKVRTYVEPSKVTLGEYLVYRLAGGPARGSMGNTARDYQVSVGHIKTKLGDVRLQALNSRR